jgi:hypothetical protein
VTIVELLRNGENKSRGEFEFNAIPASGDRIVIPSGMGGLDIMKVVYIEHSPILLPKKFYNEEKVSSTRIFVEIVDDVE